MERPHRGRWLSREVSRGLSLIPVNGVCVLRYDNETGKGDHKHVGEEQTRYAFTTAAQLLADFWDDVDHWRF